jgi:hypothetical protein
MFHLIWYILIGLISGVIAKSVMHVHMTIFWTIVLGIIGSIIGGAQEFEPNGEGAREIKQIYKFTCELLNSKTAHQSKENKHGKKTRLAASA